MNTQTWQQLKRVFHAALDLKAEDRAAFLASACDGDNELLLEVEKLLASHDDAAAFLVSPALVDAGVITPEEQVQNEGELSRIGQRIGPYEIVREIGRGGMGSVFLAIRADDQYRKQVAIKLVNRGMDTDAILRRFMMERQILANLDHPNIARLLEGGATPDGLPYFVMDFIEGEPITGYCEAHRLTTPERLELFREVCSALQYAHQNLVVHCDIKPSNVLVTTDGTPKLLDFGIAKMLSPAWATHSAADTVSIMRPLTPEYASPEQLRGLPITTVSDVYCLGVVLYELLSGYHPHRSSSREPEEMIRIVLGKEPERPSLVGRRQTGDSRKGACNDDEQLTSDNGPLTSKTIRQSAIGNRELRGDLDNIVLKALRREPERRYASAQELSEDIRRHLEGLPVSASPDTLSYRWGKFVRRNRVGVFAAAIVILTLLTATGITTWKSLEARRERDTAEQRFNQIRKLANLVLFEYHDGIEKLPGSTPIREKMIRDALEYLDNLSSQGRGDASLERELATAYEKVGDVLGNPYGANLGDQDGAIASYRKALLIREKLSRAETADAQTKLELSQGYKKVADIHWARGDNQDALANYRRALAGFSELAQSDPKNSQYVSSINLTLNGIGNVQRQSGDFKGALETYRKFLANAEVLLAADPTNTGHRRDVAIAKLKVGDALAGDTDYTGALQQYEKAVTDFSTLAASAPNDTPAARLLGLGYSRIAMVYRRLGQFEKAASFNLKAIEQQKQVAAADPRNVQSRFDISVTWSNLADNYLQMKQLDSAAASVREAIRIFSETLSTNPGYSQAQGNLGATYVTYAEVLLAKHDTNWALENYRKALTILEREPVRSAQTVALANAYEGLGDVCLQRASQTKQPADQRTGSLREACDWFQKSLAVWRTLEQQGKAADEDKTTAGEIARKIEQCR